MGAETILFWIVVGVAAGWLARIVVPNETYGGIVTDFLVGILGAVCGGFLFRGLVGYSLGGWIGSIAVAFVGAVVLLSVLRLVGRRPGSVH